MSLSSLPNIFRQTRSPHTTHRKQGGSFSLHLNGESNSNQIRPNSTSHNRQYSTLDLTKHRSASSSAMRNKYSSNNDQNNRLLLSSRSRQQVVFKEGVQLLGGVIRRGGNGLAVMNISNVCYQKLSSRMVDLEQADSIKNNMLSSIKQMGSAQIELKQMRRKTNQIRSSFGSFINTAVQHMDQFNNHFSQSLKLCYGNLSKLRRQTNEQIRGCKKELQKINNQIAVCKSVLNHIASISSQLTNSTLLTLKQSSKSNIPQSPPIDRPQSPHIDTPQSPRIDFEEISQIPGKTSRGATANLTQRTKHNQQVRNAKRRSADWQIEQLRGVVFE